MHSEHPQPPLNIPQVKAHLGFIRRRWAARAISAPPNMGFVS